MGKELVAQQKEIREKILSYKNISEANVIACLFDNPESIYTSDITLQDFDNNCWKVLYAILDGITSSGKLAVDSISVGQYLELHPSLKSKYEEYGGYQTIQDLKTFAKSQELEGQLSDLKKWQAVKKLQEGGICISPKQLSNFADVDAEHIYDLLTATLNDAFIKASGNTESEDLFDSLEETVENLDAGSNLGLLTGHEYLDAETGGIMRKGNITSIGSLSGTGKSWITFMLLLPIFIKGYNDREKNNGNYEKLCIIINEENVQRFRIELLVYFANNILGKPLKKSTLRNGHFNSETKQILKETLALLKEYQDAHLITIVPLERWSVKRAEKVISKFYHLGVNYFVIDTFKSGYDTYRSGEAEWQTLAEDMHRLHDICKEAGLNVGLLTTIQLSKGSAKSRVYSQQNVGKAKNLIDTQSLSIMFRRVAPEEYSSQSKALNVYKLEKVGSKTEKIPQTLEEDKMYYVMFIVKNRFGRANDQEIVWKVDLGVNKIEEVGLCRIVDDSFN